MCNEFCGLCGEVTEYVDNKPFDMVLCHECYVETEEHFDGMSRKV